MRLLVDAQCVQSTSSLRGIGRYALSLTRALVREAGEHRVEVLLNAGDDPGRLMRARDALEGFLPPRSIHVFDAAWAWNPPYDDRRRPAAEAAYAAAVRSIGPDVLLVGSPFEGDTENVMSIKRSTLDPPTAAVLYDLIPAIDPSTYLLGPGASIYWRRFESFKRCDALLAISQYSAGQAVQLLGGACPPVTPVWGGPFPSGEFPAFEPHYDDDPTLVVPRRFVLSVGGDHPRKNLDRLVQAWAAVPTALRAGTPLVIACRLNTGTIRRLRRIARRHGLAHAEVVLTGGVSESTLHELYARAIAFVFPSTEEGLGMPPLEAMSAGCPTVLATGSSLSELSDDPSCYFDGTDVRDIARSLTKVLSDEEFRARLRDNASTASERFTWQQTARRAWAALEQIPPTPKSSPGDDRRALVKLSDHAAMAELATRPGPVLLNSPLPVQGTGPFGVAVDLRALLAPATALVACDRRRASEAVRAGVLDLPLVLEEPALDQVAHHDFLDALRQALSELPPLTDDVARAVVTSALRPPRWTLQRPRPVWLLVTAAPAPAAVTACDHHGIDLAVVRPEGAVLAACADVVLVDAEHLSAWEHPLADARRRGAIVVALHIRDSPSPTTPAWCQDVQLDGLGGAARSWDGPLLPPPAAWGRTTGWPWSPRE